MVTVNYHGVEIVAVIELKNKIRGLIDSEYDNIKDFNEDDLHDYLASIFIGLPREITNEIYEEIY